MKGLQIQGVAKLVRQLETHSKNAGKGMRKGLYRGGLLLQRESMKIVPVDLGFLRASAQTRLIGSGLRSEVLVGYTSEYAIYVHENLEARHKPGKQAKYLEQPLRDHHKAIVDEIKAGMREDWL